MLRAISLPSAFTCSTGLMLSMEPKNAADGEHRPPRLRKFRSSTVNQEA